MTGSHCLLLLLLLCCIEAAAATLALAPTYRAHFDLTHEFVCIIQKRTVLSLDRQHLSMMLLLLLSLGDLR